jgi:hypothetical protein
MVLRFSAGSCLPHNRVVELPDIVLRLKIKQSLPELLKMLAVVGFSMMLSVR